VEEKNEFLCIHCLRREFHEKFFLGSEENCEHLSAECLTFPSAIASVGKRS
jgi:hypothetical protein